ncbi:MAG: hypothetical protein KDK72_00340 [Chlamydiia bacterium]|nr:hypothetical protein [Chlamydiia bacterium]
MDSRIYGSSPCDDFVILENSDDDDQQTHSLIDDISDIWGTMQLYWNGCPQHDADYTTYPLVSSSANKLGEATIANYCSYLETLSSEQNVEPEAAIICDGLIGQHKPSEIFETWLKRNENVGPRPSKVFIPYVYRDEDTIDGITTLALSYFYKLDHIVVFEFDFNLRRVCYFDPKGFPMDKRYCPKEFKMVDDIKIIMDKYMPGGKVEQNLKKHQYDINNCGIYVLNYIERRLLGETFKKVVSSPIPLNEIEKCRKTMAEELKIFMSKLLDS